MVEYINHIAQLWWAWSVDMFWQVGLLIALLGCLDAVLRKWAWPQVRYALWLLVLIKLVLPPGITLPSSITSGIHPWVVQTLTQTPASDTSAHEVTIVFDGVPHLPAIDAGAAARPAGTTVAFTGPDDRSLSDMPVASAAKPVWQSYAMGAWLMGMGVLAVWLLGKLHRLRQGVPDEVRRTALPESFDLMVKRCARQIGLRKIPRVVVTTGVICPAVTGIVTPVLLMPVGFLSKLSRKDAEHMLLHEFAHVRRGDLWAHSMYMALQIIYWYNPLLWLVSRQMHHLREVCCDATVANALREKTMEYRDTLLDVARRYLARPTEPGLGLLGLFEDSNRLAVRLAWLKKKTWRYPRLRWASIALVVGIMTVTVLPMAQGAVREAPDAPTPPAATVVPQSAPNNPDIESLEQQMQGLAEQMQALEQHKLTLQKELEQLKLKNQQAQLDAQAQALKTQQVQDKNWKQWAKQMKVWSQQMEAWASSPEFQENIKQYSAQLGQDVKDAVKAWQDSEEYQAWQEDMKAWQKDMDDWAEGMAQSAGSMWQSVRGREPNGVKPFPSMPSMPPMPAMPQNFPKFHFKFKTHTQAFGGPMVDISFDDEPLKEALEELADETDTIIIAEDGVNGSVTLECEDVPLEQALQMICDQIGASWEKKPDYYLVGRHKVLPHPAPAPAPASAHAPGNVPVPHIVVPDIRVPHISGPNSTSHMVVTPGSAHDLRQVQTIEEKQQGDRYLLKRQESYVTDLTPGSVLALTNENGNITVTGSDASQCAVQAIIQITAPTKDQTRALSKQVGFDVAKAGSAIAIRSTQLKKVPAKQGYSIDYSLVVPHNTTMSLTNEDGHIKVENVNGAISITNEDGSVICKNLDGNLHVKLEDGQVKLEQCTFKDLCRIQMEDGQIKAADITGSLRLRLEDGQADIHYSDTVPDECRIDIRLEDGQIRLSAPAALFPEDLSGARKETEDGQRWSTQTGDYQVDLRVEDGRITVEPR